MSACVRPGTLVLHRRSCAAFRTAEEKHDETSSDTRSDAARTASGQSARTAARHGPAGSAAARLSAPGHSAARTRLRHADRPVTDHAVRTHPFNTSIEGELQ